MQLKCFEEFTVFWNADSSFQSIVRHAMKENYQTLLIVDFKWETEKSFPSCKPTLSSDIRT